MRSYEFISELRKKSDQNIKLSVTDELKRLDAEAGILPGTNIKNCFVSYTDIPKLGINPSSDVNDHDTPLGIFAIPSNYLLSKNGEWMASTMEYQRNYANIFSVSGNILALSSMTNSQFEHYTQQLIKLLQIKDKRWTYDALQSNLSNLYYDYEKEEDEDDWYKVSTFGDINSIGGKFWGILHIVSSILYPNNKALGKNILLRKISVDGCFDTTGIIHIEHRSEAVFFSTSVIKNIHRIQIHKTKFDYSNYEIITDSGEVINSATDKKTAWELSHDPEMIKIHGTLSITKNGVKIS